MPSFKMLGLFEAYIAGSPHGFLTDLTVVKAFCIKAPLFSAIVKTFILKKKKNSFFNSPDAGDEFENFSLFTGAHPIYFAHILQFSCSFLFTYV